MKRWLFIFFIPFSLTLAAQEQINPVIRVERLYDAQLIEVTKPMLDTSVPDSVLTMNTSFQYSIFDKPLFNLYEFTPLPSATVKTFQTPDRHFGYINLGTGYPWTPRADIILHTPLGSDWFAGIQARHRSLLDEDTRAATEGSFTLEHRGKNNTFRIRGLGEHQNNTYADFDILSSMPGLDRQNYYNTGVEIETYSLNNTPGSWHYYWKSGYRHAKNTILGPFDSLPVIRENILDIEASTGHCLAEGFSINIGASAKFVSNRWTVDGISASRAVLHVFPHILWSGHRYKVGAGVKIGYLLRPDGNNFGVFPWFDAHLTVADDWLTLYAKMEGTQRLNTYQERMRENPWVFANEKYDAIIPWHMQAGLTGTLGDRFHYNLYGSYRYTKNQFFYGTQNNTQGYPGLYDLHYANETRYTAGGSLSFRSDPFEAGVTGEWHHYALSSGNSPWHKPVWEVSGYARYNWRERIIINATGYWRDACFAPSWIDGAPDVTVPGFFDLGVRMEYVMNRFLSAYVFGSNLLNKDISYFYLYPNPGLTFGGGVTFRF